MLADPDITSTLRQIRLASLFKTATLPELLKPQITLEASLAVSRPARSAGPTASDTFRTTTLPERSSAREAIKAGS